MRKSLFIIPIVKVLISAFLLICYQVGEVGATTNGCHVSFAVAERLFFTPYPPGGANAWITTGVIDPSGAVGGYRENGSTTFGCIGDIGGTCTVYQQYEISAGPPQVVGVRIYKIGVYASIDPINCPIDDYIPLLAIFNLSLGLYKIRRSNLKMPIYEDKLNHGSV